MEEIQIRDALRHHVTDNEPPMGLSAAVLLSKGRRRYWWRLGAASGGTVAAISMIGTIVLVPMSGAGPSLDAACGLIVVTDYVAGPSTEPDYPSQIPSPYPTNDATPYPTYEPTPYPTVDPSFYPTLDPSGYPTADPSFYPTLDPSFYPTAGPSFYPTLDPSGYPTLVPYPSFYPTPEPTGSVRYPDPRWPTATPHADEQRMREMECYLKRELQRMVPGAKFAGTSPHEPLSVYTGSLRWTGMDMEVVYVATAIIIDQSQTVQFAINVDKPSNPPNGPEHGWSFEKRADLIIRQTTTEDGMTMSEVFTPHSLISIYITGTLLSPEELIELASATEVDMFR